MKKIYDVVLDFVFFVLKGVLMLIKDIVRAVYKFGKYFYDGIVGLFTK